MTLQDLNKKIVLVVRNDLPSWQVLNTVSHLAAYLGNKMKIPFDTGNYFVTADGVNHPRNTQYPIIAVSAKPAQLPPLMQQVRTSDLLYLGYIREMIDTNLDDEIVTWLGQKKDEEIEYLGIGVFGEKATVDDLTKKFSLWR